MADPIIQSPINPHFFQPLLPGFDSFLNIPVKFFSAYIQGIYEGQTVELRSDASEITWKVKMEGRRLTVGWKDFAGAHDFRVGDIIVLRHEGALVFHVTALGPSCCEIQYVEACNDDDQENSRNMPTEQSQKTELESSLDEENKDNIGKLTKHVKKRIPEAEAKSCFVAHVTYSNLREDTLEPKIVLVNEGARTWTLILKFKDSSRSFYLRDGWRSFCYENGLKPGDSITLKLGSTNTTTHLLLFSNAVSKSVSTKDSCQGKINKSGDSYQNVPSSSSSVSEDRFLTLIVTPSSIHRSRIYLPKTFTRGNKIEKAGGKKITLFDRHGVEWPVTLLMDKTYTRMILSSGLKEFFNANGVRAYESVVLELVWEETSTLPMFKFCSKIKT